MPKLIQIATLGLQDSAKIKSLYQSLSEENEEIRLLNILPSEEYSVIECTMSTTSLRSQPTFTALSYTWGDPSLDDKIIVNNQAVYVTVNLATALRYIRNRYSPETVTIWVDALCINQEDQTEKSHQVQFMRQIYRRACRVIGFLGESADESPYAIDLLHRIAHEIFGEQDIRLDGPGDERVEPSEGQESWLERIPELHNFRIGDDESYRVYKAISSLLVRPYWERVWIRQEIALAHDLQFLVGNDSITWDILVRALEPFGGPGSPNSICETPFAREWALGESKSLAVIRSIQLTRTRANLSILGQRILSLPQAVLLSKGAEVSNPLDYIYGMLGLVDSDMTVNYESASVESLYTDFSRKVFKDREPYSPLYWTGVGFLRQFPSLPSWIIDLSTFGRIVTSWDLRYKAAGDTFKSMAEPIIHENKLQIKVGFIDSIAKIVQVEENTGILDVASMAIKLFELGDEPSEFLWRYFWTVILGKLNELTVPLQVESPHSQDLYRAFLWFLWGCLEQCDLGGSELQILKAAIQAEFLWLRFPHLVDEMEPKNLLMLVLRRIWTPPDYSEVTFRTERGYMGRGLRATRRKDKVCIIPGHSNPLLLRNTGQSFQLVSTCYIPDLMNGEAVGDDAEAWAASLEKIEII